MPPYSLGRCGAHRPAFFTFSLISARSSSTSVRSAKLSPSRRARHSRFSLGMMSRLTISAVRMRMSLIRSSRVAMGFTFMAMGGTVRRGGGPAPCRKYRDRVERRALRVHGVVQGVGFRPFVHRLATALGVAGFVGNDAAGVFVEAEAEPATLDEFVRRLRADAPRLAVVTGVEASAEPLPPCGTAGFTIVPSHHDTSARTSLPPDVATCPACLAEVFAPADRRYRYPFANCTECGPRLTIIRDLPYDRPTTTMAGFAMCAECRREYDDPSDRRYHAQPIACPTCGPQLTYHPGADGDAVHGTDACLAAFHTAIAAGAVVAVKGVGGYHLACDATNDAAVGRLRERKGRADKPFALMLPSLAAAREVAEVSDLEADALDSAAAPIVLLRRGRGATGTAERTVSSGGGAREPVAGRDASLLAAPPSAVRRGAR